MGIFKLHAPYQPSGDQPEAIAQLQKNLRSGTENVAGIVGLGKTCEISNN